MKTQPIRPLALGLAILSCAALAQSVHAAPFTVNLNPLGAKRPTSYSAVAVRAGGGRAYVAHKTAGVYIYDVSNPAAPTVVGNFDKGVTEDVELLGNYLLVATGGYGLHMMDVSNPQNPVTIKTFNVTANHVHASGGYACALSAPGHLSVIDVRNPATPVLMASDFSLHCDNASGIYVQGRYAYAGTWNAGLKVVDIGNPASPAIVGVVNSPYSTREVCVQGRYAYVGEDNSTYGGLWIIDVNTPTAPAYISTAWGASSHPYGIRVANGLAYVTDSTADAIRVFDVGDPFHPVQVGIGYCEDSAMDVAVEGDRVYVAQQNQGLKVFGLSFSGAVAPVFATAPANRSVTAGQSAAFAAAATGAPNPSIRWQRSINGGLTWEDLTEDARHSGVETPNLQISTTVSMDGYRFRAVATSVAGTNVSGAAMLAVSGLPLITVQPQSGQLLAGQSATLSVTAFGATPLQYQWCFHQGCLAGATNATLALNRAGTQQAGDYSVIVSNSCGAVTSTVATLTIFPSLTLPIALDAPTLTWNTSGAGAWQAQTLFQHDGFAAGRSGSITHGQQSVLETTVAGPSMLTFWWKVSSETNYDCLKFLCNGVEEASISGNIDWQPKTYFLPSGVQTLRWVYSKDGSTSSSFDAGWLDEVRFTSARPQLVGPSFSDGSFKASFSTLNGSNYVIEYKDSLSQPNWTILRTLTGSGASQMLSDTPGIAPQRFYRVRMP